MDLTNRQPRRVLTAKDAAEALFAKRAAPSAVPRILEDTSKPVVVEMKRRKTAAANANAPTSVDHAVVAAVSGGGGNLPPNSSHANDFPSASLAFVKRGDAILSAEEAAYLTRHCVHPIQQHIRPLDHPSAAEHIAVLASIMATPGAWMDETQLRLGVLDGRLWIMDGNHRIRGQAQSGQDIRWNIKIDLYASESEFRAAFHKFNTNSRTRSQAQILGATGFATDFGISRQMATSMFDAMTFIIAEFRTGRSHADVLRSRVVDTRLDMAAKFGKEAVLFDECLKKSDNRVKKKLLIAGVTAVALVTLRHRPDEAFEFWNGVAKNDGLKKGDPRHTLTMDLLTRAMNKGAAHQSMAAPAAAWNAFYEGRSLSLIKVLDVDAVRIAGTPYKG